MGVPSFFRWLLEKYPRVIKYVKEEFIEYNDNGERILPDSSGKNPNGVEYDNLYLDMNGIIHPCCHPESGPQPKDEDEMISNVFKYIEHIFSMVRPRKLLYLAIDGVAPRAKMNQQRARRFRAAQEREELITTRQKLERYYHSKGWNVPTAPPSSWDHNVITPGTPFMDKLAQSLRYWIGYKLHNDSGWKGIKVILSDANIPGEGEHKIAQFIRRCRGLNGYDPNTKHVLYGLDADLFMLGLATHEIYFTILREEVLFGKNRPCNNCGIAGHWADKCRNPPKELNNTIENNKTKCKPFVFADLFILREYLEYELFIDNCKWWNLERIIDDFVFLCFFVGNDFLPHLPSLEIREGAIDNLLKYYKQFLPKFGGFLTDSGGKIYLNRVQLLLSKLGDIEDEVFKNRISSDRNWEKREENKKIMKRKERILNKKNKDEKNNNNNNTIRNIHDINLNECKLSDEYDENEIEFLEFFDEYNNLDIDSHFMEKDFEHQLKHIHRISQKSQNVEPEEEKIIFGSSGFKQKYYFNKMKINYDKKPELLTRLIFEYIRGLCWVFKYYYCECVSWSWYYPFHYSPFASDLINIIEFENKFEFNKIKSKPFTPFGQLMGVLPASSGKIALPNELSKLMYDKSSPIVDFYPTDFKLDLNGKMYNWQAVVLLPFVDAKRLANCIKPFEIKLCNNDNNLKRMNSIGKTLLLVNKTNQLARIITPIYDIEENNSLNDDDIITIDHQLSQGINGYISINNENNNVLISKPTNKIKKLMNLSNENENENGFDVIACTYQLPNTHEHKCQLLDGCKIPENVLDIIDFEHMEKAPRFGKPKYFKRRDTHYNYNRGWDANIGYVTGKYKAKHNKNSKYELNYQPTRKEYNDMYNNDNNYKHAAILNDFKPQQKQQQQWLPKNNNNNIHSMTSNSNGPYKCVNKFPVFNPYPNQCDVWNHRPINAPYTIDPNIDLKQINNNNNKNKNNNSNYNNNKRYYNNARNYNSRRNNNNNYYQQQQQQQQPQQHTTYYNQIPTHQQWYPQQQYHQPQQTTYYNNYYQNQYQQQQQQNYYRNNTQYNNTNTNTNTSTNNTNTNNTNNNNRTHYPNQSNQNSKRWG